MTKSIAPSEAFRAFTRYMIQDYEMFGSLDGVIYFGLRCMNTDDPALIPEFSNYLKRILVPSVSDAQLENLWNSSGAEFGGGGRWVRHFLTRTLEIVEEDAPNGILRKRPVQLKPM